MDKGEKRKDVSTRLPTLAPEIMAVGPERPRESQEEEGGGERPRIGNANECGRSGPPTPNPKQMAVRPESPDESRKEEGDDERTRPKAEAREMKDKADKAAEGEATTGPEKKIGRDRLEQTKRRKVVTRGRTPQHMKALKES